MKKPVLAISLSFLLTWQASAIPFSPTVTADAYDSSPDATPTANSNNDPGPDLNDSVNLLLGTAFLDNEDIDGLMIGSTSDNVWTLPAGSGTVALIGLSAGNLNTLGFYTDLGTGALKTPLLGPSTGFGFAGDGTAANPFPAATFSTGSNFGFYLNSSGTDYFSEPGLNPAGFEHMMTFSLPGLAGTSVFVNTGSGPTSYTFSNPVLVGWEDLPYDPSTQTLGDDDYDDMMYVMDAVPASVPASGSSMVFLAMGLAGLGLGIGRRKSS